MNSKKRSRVVIDGRMVGEVSHGIARYVRMLAKGLAEQSLLQYDPVFLCQPGSRSLFSGFETIEIRTPFLDPREMLTLPIALWRIRADLYHSPSFSSLLTAPCPWVATVHDLNHLTYGGQFERTYYETVLRSFLERAKKVMTISQFSKREIQQWNSKLDPEVVPNAIDPLFSKGMDEKSLGATLHSFGVERGKYWLCLSNEKKHKNLPTLVGAYTVARERSGAVRSIPLLINAQSGYSGGGILNFSGLKDSDVLALMLGARAVLFPSVYEGFGLPPVEALVAGTGVMVSDIPAHREALGQITPSEGIWIPPLKEDRWVEEFVRNAEGGGFRVSPQTQARLLANYSVETLGRNMDRIYRRVLGLDV